MPGELRSTHRPHSADRCQAKNPSTCPYHGATTDAAVKRNDINAFLDAKEKENKKVASPEQIRRENFFLTTDLAPTFCDFSSDRTAYITIIDSFTKNPDGSQEGYVMAATQLDYNEDRVDDTKFYVRKHGSDIKLYKDKTSTEALNHSEIFDMFMNSRKQYKK